MFYTLLCLQYKNTPEIKKKQSLWKFIIMKNMDAFDLMNINMTMYSSCKKKYCKGFSQEEDSVAEKFSREIIRNSLMEDHYD